MANDYINPFSAMDPGIVAPGKTAMEAFLGYENRQKAMPFVDLARQSQEQSLQKQQQEMQEWSSPEASKARMSGYGAKTTQNQQVIDLGPQELATKRKTLEDEYRASGILTDEKMAKARQYINDHSYPAYQDFTTSLAGLGEHLSSLPPGTPQSFKDNLIKQLYPTMVRDWQTKHPNEKLPAHLQNFDEQTMPQIAMATYKNNLYLERQAKERIEKMKEESAEKRQRMSSGATIEAARISNRGAMEREELKSGSKDEASRTRREIAIAKTATDFLANDITFMTEKDPAIRQQKIQEAKDFAESFHGKSKEGPVLPEAEAKEIKTSAEHAALKKGTRYKYQGKIYIKK